MTKLVMEEDKLKVSNDLDLCDTLPSLLDKLQAVFQRTKQSSDNLSSELISPVFLEEVRSCISQERIHLYFGETLRNLKCKVVDEDGRQHEICFQYKGNRKLCVTSVNVPYSTLQEREYSSIREVEQIFRRHLEDLTCYFRELENIDRGCSVMEPVNPSFKEEYRRILLDERTWLHIEVTPEGLATNVHLIGSSEYWHDKLQSGLLKWDHDLDIVRNIMNIFDLTEFPVLTQKTSRDLFLEDKSAEATICSICLCNELPDVPGVPQPLCQNPICGIYFHRLCLFQWLVACAGGRPPAFGVATGSCPTCLHPITCNEKDC